MYQGIERTAIAQNRRVVAHVTLDTKLNILSCPPELHRWSGFAPGTLIKLRLFDLFPQLESSQDLIFESVKNAGNAFVYRYARFLQDGASKTLFDLQIEAFPDVPGKLLLTITPQTRLTAATIGEQDLAKLARHNQELLLLNRASRILTATLNTAEVLERLLQVTVQIVNAAGSSVWLWADEDEKHLVCRAAFHPGKDERLIGLQVASGKGIVGWVAKSNKGTIVSDPANDGRFYPHIDKSSGFLTTSLLAVPIHIRSHTLGVLEVVNKRDGRFTQKDLAYAEMLAASAAIAIDNAHLIETLQQKMDDLTIHNAELEAFDHTVAHDLQNPLALVVGFADLLKTQGNEITEEERARSLELLVQNARRMSNIIQELLMLSSVRKRDVETHPLDMAVLVQNALDRLRFLVQEYKAQIILPDQWAVAAGYGPWIEEVWENLISNALKYGGNPPQIELGSTVLADGRIQFWIRDNGQGISPDKQQMLFTPFTQLNEVRVTGHGLGLSIVCRIMEKLGGDVDVKSQVGAGSTFCFTLPAYKLECDES
ncbi:MAG: hypothetical protein CL608_14535 [Anaerolineaceae bacterium]|nr:hypothetical protein [Anaerolineaceae bacterium]